MLKLLRADKINKVRNEIMEIKIKIICKEYKNILLIKNIFLIYFGIIKLIYGTKISEYKNKVHSGRLIPLTGWSL